MEVKPLKVAFCTPTITKPYPQFLAAMEATVPLLDAAGIEHQMVFEVGCPYISHARANLTRKALNAGADVIVYLDHDMSWSPQSLLTLIQTEGDVLAGVYRFKEDVERYMGTVQSDANGRPMLRADGLVVAEWVPAGFLKVSRGAIRRLMRAYPELLYGEAEAPHIDLFNHGAHDFVWYGEDYAFSRRYTERIGPIWIVPNLDISHWGADGKEYPGNFHEHLLRQPGGSKSANPSAPPPLRVVA